MKKSLYILLAFTLLQITFVEAQDPHFSQFFSSPLTLNPAFTGKFDGLIRFAADHRDQWPTIPKAYVTTSASVDFGIFKNKLPENDVLGIGFSGLSDQSANSALKLNYGSVSFSYHKAFDEDGYNTLGVGFQGTYSSMMLDITKLNFEDQLTQNGFTGTTSEVLSNGSTQNYFDMNAGLLFSGSTDGINNYYAGAAMYHINQPSVGFIDQMWKLSPRYCMHAGGSFPLGNAFTLNASAIAQIQNNANETVIGAALSNTLNASANANSPTNIYFGAWLRLNDAIIPYVGLEFNNLRVGLSYDVNVSQLKAATQSRGGTELSLIYVTKKKERVNSIPCPTF